jgi:hypothetical protein
MEFSGKHFGKDDTLDHKLTIPADIVGRFRLDQPASLAQAAAAGRIHQRLKPRKLSFPRSRYQR